VTELIPKPDGDDIPLNHPTQVTLANGEKATIKYEPTQQVTEFRIPVVAISKYRDSTYKVRMDGETVYPESGIPPTDIDDLVPAFVPSYAFDKKMKITIKNLSSSTRTYHIQPIGWEVNNGA
jgi:hypothetical protein